MSTLKGLKDVSFQYPECSVEVCAFNELCICTHPALNTGCPLIEEKIIEEDNDE